MVGSQRGKEYGENAKPAGSEKNEATGERGEEWDRTWVGRETTVGEFPKPRNWCRRKTGVAPIGFKVKERSGKKFHQDRKNQVCGSVEHKSREAILRSGQVGGKQVRGVVE